MFSLSEIFVLGTDVKMGLSSKFCFEAEYDLLITSSFV